MQKPIVRSLFVAGFIVALGGCQVLGPSRLSRTDGEPAGKSRAGQVAWTAEGRGHLDVQRNGLAIEAFNRAIASGEEPAPALNGLGVAYSRLGRADLAYRFFRQAAIADPANPVYARNLVTLTNSPAFTLAQMRAGEPARAASASPVAPQGPATAAAQREPGKLYRESNRQFTLVTRSDRADDAPARADCGAARKGAKTLPCAAPALPVVASRRTAKVASSDQPASALPAAADAKPGDSATPEAGKRKVVHNPAAGARPASGAPAA